jgi:hypothetical protein
MEPASVNWTIGLESSTKLEAQYSGQVNLWQGCHEIAKKSSEVVSPGAPAF